MVGVPIAPATAVPVAAAPAAQPRAAAVPVGQTLPAARPAQPGGLTVEKTFRRDPPEDDCSIQ